MKRVVMALALLAALAAFAGCDKTEAIYGRGDTSISAKSGETFTIRLAANPATGYEWNVTVSDNTVVSLEDAEYLPDEKDSDVAGAGGTQLLKFKARKAGAATIELVYQRSWEPQDEDERIQYTVTVN